MWHWLENTTIALTVRDSLFFTSFFSGLHIVGMALACGSALVVALRLTGAALRGYPVPDVAGTAARAVFWGLTISVVSGVLLFAPRAAAAVENIFFQWKMLLLASAVIFHLLVVRPATRRSAESSGGRAAGAIGFLLWLSVASLGTAYILLE